MKRLPIYSLLILLLVALATTSVWAQDPDVASREVPGESTPAPNASATPPSAPELNIVGGTIADPDAWPWMAALVSADEPNAFNGQFCGGALIDREWVVTAAHCTFDENGNAVSPADVDVVLGRHRLSSSDGERIGVVEIIRHPSYDDLTLDFDIALFHLQTPSAQATIPVVSPSDSSLFAPGVLATIAGWGATSNGLFPTYPDRLRQVSVPLVSNATCNGPLAYNGEITDNMLCAGLARGGKDSCSGDSGGPLMVPDASGEGWMQAGIVSWGDGCAVRNKYGVYTRIANFSSWIESNTGGTSVTPSPTPTPTEVTPSPTPTSTPTEMTPSPTPTATPTATPDPVNIADVRISNVRDTTFTVSWTTDRPANGKVRFGTDPDNLNATAPDDRGDPTTDDTHYVTLQGLTPNTTYYLDAVSDATTDNHGGQHFTVTTGPTLSLPATDTVYGQVFDADGTTPAAGCIIYVSLQDRDGNPTPGQAAPLAALVDSDGYWSVNLGNARTQDLSSYFGYSVNGDQLRLEAQCAADGMGIAQTDTGSDAPGPDIIAGPIQSFVTALQLGWNAISLALNPTTDYTAENLCTEINNQGGSMAEINRWYAGGWDGHICGLASNDFSIDPATGYFIKSDSPSSWTLQGLASSTGAPLELQSGWNAIGISHNHRYTAESLCTEINNQGGSVAEVNRWHAGGWDGHICGLSFNEFPIEPGTGYFIKVNSASVVTISGLGSRSGAAEFGRSRASTRERVDISGRLLAASVVLDSRNQSYRSGVSAVRLSNVRATSFTVSWLTAQPTTGEVRFGTDPADVNQVTRDNRGAATTTRMHYVTLIHLSPNTKYYFDIVAGETLDDNSGAHYTVTTGPTLSLPATDNIFGQLLQTDGKTPAEGATVYISLQDKDGAGSPGQSAELSSLVGRDGYWSVNLGNARSSDLNSYFLYSAGGDAIQVTAEAADANGPVSRQVDTANDRPAPSMMLCCDFNGNGRVDVGDVQVIATKWGNTDSVYDFSGSGMVDVADLAYVSDRWRQTSNSMR